MVLEDSIVNYEGKIEILEEIKKDFKNFSEDAFQHKKIGIKTKDYPDETSIMIQPSCSEETIDSVRIPDNSKDVYIDYTNGKTIFYYNEKRYFVSKSNRF